MRGLVAATDVLDLPDEGGLPPELVEEIIARAAGYERWTEQVACPLQLVGALDLNQ